jgi:hypothetical protein
MRGGRGQPLLCGAHSRAIRGPLVGMAPNKPELDADRIQRVADGGGLRDVPMKAPGSGSKVVAVPHGVELGCGRPFRGHEVAQGMGGTPVASLRFVAEPLLAIYMHRPARLDSWTPAEEAGQRRLAALMHGSLLLPLRLSLLRHPPPRRGVDPVLHLDKQNIPTGLALRHATEAYTPVHATAG